MTVLIMYTTGFILWLTCVILQHNIIKQQHKVIHAQDEIIFRQEIKQGLPDIIIKEQKELLEMQQMFINNYITNDSASEAYSQTYKKGGVDEI